MNSLGRRVGVGVGVGVGVIETKVANVAVESPLGEAVACGDSGKAAAEAGEADAAIAAIRVVQPDWADRPVRDRLSVIGRLRKRLAADCRACAATASRPNMSEADILLAEVMPLLAACRFLENQAAGILAPRRPAGRRPPWLLGTSLVVRRLPFGTVLILAPRNYPLLLPAVQVVQALVAGNGVMVKPAPGSRQPMMFLADALRRAGLPDGLLAVLPDTELAGIQALRAGADKVVLTGSGETGRQVLAQLAKTVTPTTMELSGDDALIVLPGARIADVARAIAYGLLLNGGATCIAPRRIIAAGGTGPELVDRLQALLPGLPPRHVPDGETRHLSAAFASAERGGGRTIGDPAGLGSDSMRPLILLAPGPGQCLPPSFGPVASLVMVADADAAVAVANAGCVEVNDVIVATADPRLPFGGAGASGFGVTRGAEGLLEMTRPQALASRRRPVASRYRLLPATAASWIARGLRLLYG